MKYTIIVTVYNKEKYLDRCLNTVCNQNYDKYEVLVINDGSTDNSDKIIKKYKRKYKFKYISKPNTGVADTRNLAVQEVKTDYFLFVDADDYISRDLLKTADNYDNYDVLSFSSIKLDKHLGYVKKIDKPVFDGGGDSFFKRLVDEKCVFTVPWGYIYNTGYFKDNNFIYPKGEILEDFYLTPFILMSAKRIISIDYIGYYYVDVDDSITSLKNIRVISETYLKFFKLLSDKIYDYNYSSDLINTYLSFVSGTLLWNGVNLKRDERIYYVKGLRKLGVLNNVQRSLIKKILIDLRLYYWLLKIFKGD